MKMNFKKLPVIISLAGLYILFSSHFIWTETASIATVGKEHLVSLMFGEYNFSQLEVAGGRLDEMDGLQTIAVGPGEQVNKLKLKKEKDRFTASFVPDQTGIYQVLTSNAEAKVMDLRKSDLGIVKPMYYSRQVIKAVDNKSNPDQKEIQLKPYFDLDLIPEYNKGAVDFQVNKPVNFHSYFKKLPVKGGKIYAHAPNGWSKEIDADDKGLCSFTPVWKGQYVIDWVYTEHKPGTFNGKEYESVRHRAVLTINVTE